MHEMDSERPAIRPAILLLVAAVLSAVVFLPSLSGDWIFDDRNLIASNPYVHSFAAWTRWFTTDFWNVNEEMVRSHHLLYWRPAINATYALDWVVGGGTPVLFHLTNLVWQAVAGALAFHVLRRWIGAPGPALVAAVLFAIHPTKAESVAWIAGRTDVLCMVFILIASEGMARRRRGARGGLALEIAGTLAAYLCKEQAIVLPMFAMIEAWVGRDRPALDWPALRAMIVAAIPQAIVAIVYLGLRTALLPIGFAAAGPSPVTHALAVLESYGRFTALVVAPHDMSIQQGVVHAIGGPQISALHAVLGAATLVALVALAVGCRKRAPAISVGLGFYLLTLLPTANVVYTHTSTVVSERFLYLPTLGLAFLAGWLLARTTPRRRRAGYALAGAVGLAFAAIAMSHAADFRDEQEFWAREIALHPDNVPLRDTAISVAVSHREYRQALAMLAAARAGINDLDREPSADLTRVVLTAHVLAFLTPDRDTARLRSIDAFCAALLAPDRPVAVLSLPDGQLGVDTTAKSYAAAAHDAALSLVALRTELATRLGDDARAVALGEQAVALCPTCLTTVPVASVALAAAGKYDRAEALLASLRGHVDEQATQRLVEHVHAARVAHAGATGIDPESLRARATELSSLDLWGRAYEVLAPYLDELAHAPRLAVGVAELAFRAGEPATARRLLLAAAPLTDVDAAFAQWTRSMGWQ